MSAYAFRRVYGLGFRPFTEFYCSALSRWVVLEEFVMFPIMFEGWTPASGPRSFTLLVFSSDLIFCAASSHLIMFRPRGRSRAPSPAASSECTRTRRPLSAHTVRQLAALCCRSFWLAHQPVLRAAFPRCSAFQRGEKTNSRPLRDPPGIFVFPQPLSAGAPDLHSSQSLAQEAGMVRQHWHVCVAA